MKLRIPALLAVVTGFSALATGAITGGHAQAATTAQALPIAVPHIDPSQSITPATDVYPDISLAPKQVEEAFRTAQKTHRKVLLDFGGNWCPDCLKLAGIFEVPEVNEWLESLFVIVPVNVGRINQNLDLASRYGVTLHEVPTVLILTEDGKLLNADGANTLGNARAMSAQAVIDLVDGWSKRG